jgi:hypothetical protein
LAGEQKVSHVSWRRTVTVGMKILAAGWRARFAQESVVSAAEPPLAGAVSGQGEQ